MLWESARANFLTQSSHKLWVCLVQKLALALSHNMVFYSHKMLKIAKMALKWIKYKITAKPLATELWHKEMHCLA